ncbi:MAG: DUF4157 domain-containing protein [Chloroflexaceae bacterium]|nr:DUF4157 domain-containing protein [Chloroflexaceae bacterium]
MPEPARTARPAAPARAPAPRLSTPAPRIAAPVVSPAGPPPVRLGAGSPMPLAIRAPIERSLGADLDAVRVYSGAGASHAAASLGARAFTYGPNIVLGAGARPTDLGLMAHEAAHVVQQRAAPVAQTFGEASGDPLEREARQAAEAVLQGGSFSVQGRTTEARVQRLGISDALDFFADRANLIPGFRMFTIILGVNPINMRRVERSAANILRAIVEFLPGGNLITRALDTYGVFERVGAWIEQQINTLGITGSLIRDALNRFLDSLSWRDIFNLSGVWERAKRIFSEPIERIITFGRTLITGILRFIREAILRPLARLAEGTRGYDLLKAVLGEDPITGEAVPRNAETLIGGFMKLIGQEEVWNNLKRANAVARAWAWFSGVLSDLLGFVRQIPTLFVRALQSLEIADLVLLPRAFARVAGVFGGFIGRFIAWAGQQVMNLLQIIFEVVAPAVMPYLRRVAGAFRAIIQNPVGFVRNLVRAGILGFQQFARNFLGHLRGALIGWLTGTLAGSNIYIPQALNLREILKFVLSVLGLVWQNIRQKLVRVMGEPAVAALETTFDLVVTLVREGPAAAWQRIVEGIGNLRDMVMEQIMTFVRDRVVQAAITRLLTSLNPAGAFIQAIIAIYNTVMFFVERLRQIAQVAMAFIDSLAAIASGALSAAADRVERTMAGLLTLVISFLARIAGLGRVSDAVTSIINRVRAPIDRALDRVVAWIATQARRGAGGGRGRGTGSGATATAVFTPIRQAAAELIRRRYPTGEAFQAALGQLYQRFRPQGLRSLRVEGLGEQSNQPFRIIAQVNPEEPIVQVTWDQIYAPGEAVKGTERYERAGFTTFARLIVNGRNAGQSDVRSEDGLHAEQILIASDEWRHTLEQALARATSAVPQETIIRVVINRSPCHERCVNALSNVLSTYRARFPDSASRDRVRFYLIASGAYEGRFGATTNRDLARLSSAGWQLQGLVPTPEGLSARGNIWVTGIRNLLRRLRIGG